MKTRFVATILLFAHCLLSAQDKMPYQIYSKSGKKVTYDKILAQAVRSDVVLFGEYHNNSIIHWLQVELTKDLSAKKNIILGAEMIEADNQSQLNQYLKSEINQKAFDTLARLWSNHRTDYKPLVDFAKDKSISFIATNVPRRSASKVFRGGFEVLTDLPSIEKAWMAPLPIIYDANLPGYARMMAEMGEHGGENLPKAQALKDATMAYFIAQNFRQDYTFLHYNGTYHSDYFDGIFYYLKHFAPLLKTMTIATVEQANISTFNKDDLNKADFIIVVDEDVTKTH